MNYSSIPRTLNLWRRLDSSPKPFAHSHWLTSPFPLSGILVLALGLRLWGLRFGLPYTYHVDEPTYVSAALNLGQGIIGQQTNPTGFINLLFGEYALYFVVGRLLGIFQSAADFAQAYRADPSWFLGLGRFTSAVLGTATVWITYAIGRETINHLGGLLAALLLSVAFLHARESHYAVPDVTFTFWVMTALLLCALAIRRQSLRYIYLAALSVGLAVATKWTGWPLGLSLLLTIFLCRLKLRQVALTWVAAGLGFALGGFQLFLKPGVYLEYALRELQAGEAGGFGLWQIDTVSGWWFYIKTLQYGVGTLFLGLAVLGLGLWGFSILQTRHPTRLLMLSFPLVYYLSMGSTQHYFARYAVPLVPFLALLAAATLVTISTQWPGKSWWLGGLLLISIGPSLFSSLRHDLLLTRTDTRTLAKAWIEQTIPAGAHLAQEWPIHGPPLLSTEQTQIMAQPTYEIAVMGKTGLAEQPLSWYRAQGIDYLITSSYIYNIPLVYERRNQERREFYKALDQELSQIARFSPYPANTTPAFVFDEIYGPATNLWQRQRPGPILTIYQFSK